MSAEANITVRLTVDADDALRFVLRNMSDEHLETNRAMAQDAESSLRKAYTQEGPIDPAMRESLAKAQAICKAVHCEIAWRHQRR